MGLLKNLLTGRKRNSTPTVQESETFLYCPSCGDEFRPEFTHCPVCNEELIDAAIKSRGETDSREPSEVPDITEDDELVVVRNGSLSDLKKIKRMLGEKSIPALISDDGSGCRKGCCGSSLFLLCVREQDLEKVAVIVAEEYRSSTGLDQMTAGREQTGFPSSDHCPACGVLLPDDAPSCPDCGLTV